MNEVTIHDVGWIPLIITRKNTCRNLHIIRQSLNDNNNYNSNKHLLFFLFISSIVYPNTDAFISYRYYDQVFPFNFAFIFDAIS